MKRSVVIIVSILIILAAWSPVFCAELKVPGEYGTIQSGIDAAMDGDSILIAPGTYTGTGNRDIDCKGKIIKIMSSGNADQTVIDCEKLGRAFIIQSGETIKTVISGLTLMNGDASQSDPQLYGGAILCWEHSAVTLLNCILSNNSAPESGGAFYTDGSNTIIDSCTFQNNEATITGGGAYFGLKDYQSIPAILRSKFVGNRTTDEVGRGGGIYSEQSSITVYETEFKENEGYFGGGVGISNTMEAVFLNCRFLDNSAGYGAGILTYSGGADLFGCEFSNNISTYSGGGLYDDANTRISMRDCMFESNSAGGDSGGVYIGCNTYSDCILDSCIIRNNSAVNAGGLQIASPGVCQVNNCIIEDNAASSNGGGLYFEAQCQPQFTHCIIRNNTALNQGGGAYIYQKTQPVFYNCEITGNSADGGGGIYSNSSPWQPKVYNCLIAKNTATYNGGGILAAFDTPLLVHNSTLAFNSASMGHDVYCYYGNPVFKDCIIWGNDEPIAGELGTAEITYSNVQGGYSGTGNMGSDPGFTAGPLGDYYLGNINCVNTGSGSAQDICYEFRNETACMSQLTTQTDHAADSGTVDMGYHYIISGPPATDLWDIYVRLIMPLYEVRPGDLFSTDTHCRSLTGDPEPALFFLILDVWGELYFFPEFAQYEPPDYKFGYMALDISDDFIPVLPEFIWPQVDTGMINLHFYAACTDAAGSRLISNLVDVNWGFLAH